MLRKADRLTWIVVTMSVLLALECVCGEEETTTRRVRHQRSSNRGGSNTSTEELEMEFIRNVNLIDDIRWQCGDPKPRLVYFSEAIEAVPVIPPHSVWIGIQATVLHRCEAAFGCCTPPKECRPVQKDTIRVTFKSHNVDTRDSTYYRIPYHNHTSCACMDP